MIARTSNALAPRAALAACEAEELALQPISDFPEAASGATADAGQRIADWVRAYLMRPHTDLGRAGAVCPYTPIAARSGLVRIGASAARDEDAVFADMRRAVAAFEAMECTRAQRQFRSVIVGFPHCGGDEGRARLKRVQNRLRSESTRRGKMIGLFEPFSNDKGLLNPDFRPLRSPLPLLAIRSLVENDAPFVLRNPRLAPIYLLKFPVSGTRKLLCLLWR